MKFTVSKDALLSRLQVAKQVISSKPMLPILENFLFEVVDGKLTVIASDNETTLSLGLELAEYDTDGCMAINAKMITDALKEINEQPLRFTLDPDTLQITVTYQNGEFKLLGATPDEFPTCTSLAESAHTFTTDAGDLLCGIKNVLFAVANDELRPVMNGICVDVNEDKLTLVASDGTLLIRRRTQMNGAQERGSFILPKKPASVLCGVLAKREGDVTVQSDTRNIRIIMEDTILTCRMIEGRYPNYNSVIPQDNPYPLTIQRQALISALKRVSVFANQASSLVKMEVAMGSMVLSCVDVDFSTSSRESVSCDYGGAKMTIGFKSTLLLSILNNLATDDVLLELKDASRAALLKPVDEEQDITVLLMPMQINI